MKKLPKYLYHVSFDLSHPGIFTPRVPDSRRRGEDAVNARVCVSDTLDGCLTASPQGGQNLSESLLETDDEVKIFVIDTEKLGLTLEDVLFPEELYRNGQVDDALLSGEHWILSEFVVPPEDQSIVHILSVEDGHWMPLIPFEVKSALEAKGINMENEKEVEEAYEKLCGEEMEHLCIIQEIECLTL